jgi:O-antigen chain-terminating methyltransferase
MQQGNRVAALESAATNAEHSLQRTNERIDRGDGALGDLRKRVAAAQMSVAAQERRLVRLSEAAARPPAGEGDRARALASEAAHALDALYVDFEEYFRGSEDDIKGRLRVYLPDVQRVLAQAGGRVVDLGCGRGEWLSLLREHGITARGVDTNRVQIERCRSEGLEVAEGDAVGALAALEDASLDVVTAFHLIEHLGYATLVELLDHIVRVLRPGGLVILETPNPDNVLVGSCQFYLDPTHRHPLPSPLAKFLAEARGLHDVEVRPLHPAPDYEHLQGSEVAERWNRFFYGPRDYAVLGYKA